VAYDKTLRALDREIRAIDGKGDVILQLDIREHEISTKGTPYADARPRSPRVAIAFGCKHGPLTYYCDRFLDWQSNVRAIGLGLERLRLVAETGITDRGEQYTGFKALPAGIQLGPGKMTVEEAARFIAKEGGALRTAEKLLASRAIFDATYRSAAKRLHPDASGVRAEWDVLQEAARLLEAHFTGGRP
jgi:hypothetical protein